ncbi:MAG TPA: peptidylprolyl isomerase [Candidatus Dormibacteraeota bacterium]|nr:peptidylprolyl isomerase [Candidatus Dormibacteraeota bacterium]
MKRVEVWFSLCVLAAVACATVGCKSGSQQNNPNEGQAPMAIDPALLHPETLTDKAPEVFDVKFDTTRGDFAVQVHRKWAPLGADRFYNLVQHGFFTGEAFFRVVPGFVVQFGLSPDPDVNRAWRSANIKDDPVTQSNKRGTITFATAGPNTRTTQLFINFGDNSGLDRQGFAPFGLVTSGMDVVDKIYSGYGQQPDQGAITTQGAAYLQKNFPNLDTIKSATVVPASAAQ